MAIYSINGLQGHGKSYSAIEIGIKQALEENRPIYTNIPVIRERIEEIYPTARIFDLSHVAYLEACDKGLDYWAYIQNGSLVVLDEVWRFWPSGLKVSNMKERDLSFIKEHRHRVDETGRNIDIIFVTQNNKDIACTIREMIETTIICVQLNQVGANKKFRRDYYNGCVTGYVGPQQKFTKSEYSSYKPEVYRLYKSYTQAIGNIEQGAEKKILAATIFSGWSFKIMVVAVVVLFAAAACSAMSAKKGISKIVDDGKYNGNASQESVSKSEIKPASPAVVSVPKSVISDVPRDSQVWRLVGYYRSPDKSFALLQSVGHARRRIDLKYCNEAVTECVKDKERFDNATGEARLAGMIENGASNQLDLLTTSRSVTDNKQ